MYSFKVELTVEELWKKNWRSTCYIPQRGKTNSRIFLRVSTIQMRRVAHFLQKRVHSTSCGLFGEVEHILELSHSRSVTTPRLGPAPGTASNKLRSAFECPLCVSINKSRFDLHLRFGGESANFLAGTFYRCTPKKINKKYEFDEWTSSEVFGLGIL